MSGEELTGEAKTMLRLFLGEGWRPLAEIMTFIICIDAPTESTRDILTEKKTQNIKPKFFCLHFFPKKHQTIVGMMSVLSNLDGQVV